ncbi:MAG TPA: hypothetical protein VGB90_02450 [Alphaproteobacteria bacterium]
MAAKRLGRVHLNGSVNLHDAKAVFDTAGRILGPRLKRVPDGEPGPRRLWISNQYLIFRANYFLEPMPPSVATPTSRAGTPLMRLRAGFAAKDVVFPALGYAREARASYPDFVAARRAGRLPRRARFQVSLPTPIACEYNYLADEARAAVGPIYEKAMLREIAEMCASIPQRDLAIQWDVAVEMVIFDGRARESPWDDLAGELRARFARYAKAVPRGVELGFHLCYGDFDRHHTVEPMDTRKMVEMANLIAESVRRPIHWIHMPVPIERSDGAYFAPLKGLKLAKDTELYLGLIHARDGLDGAKRRIAAAANYVRGFGVATECGMGRSFAPGDVPKVLRLHAQAADYVATL